jgi:hypothetical protein
MKTVLIFFVIGILTASGATYYRYQSFHPCDWMEQEVSEKKGLPRLIVKGQIRAQFLLNGISDPNHLQCVLAWWDFRRGNLPPKT